MDFTIKKRELTKEEKLKRAIFYYGTEFTDIDLEYDEPMYDEFGQPNVKIDENLFKFDNELKREINNFASYQRFDRTIDLKCLKCNYEELDQDWDSIEEFWDHVDYPICYCPNCSKGSFVPLDIYNKLKK